MRSEGWTRVKVGFKGNFEELALVKSDDGAGVNVRYYARQRVKIPVSVRA